MNAYAQNSLNFASKIACEQPLRNVFMLMGLYVGPVSTLLTKCFQCTSFDVHGFHRKFLFPCLRELVHRPLLRQIFENCQRTCEVNRMGENSSFIFTCYVKNVPVYDFKLVRVVLHPSVKDFFRNDLPTRALFYSKSRFK